MAVQIPKVIHQIWLGSTPMHPDMITWHRRWIELHPTWEVKLWTSGPEETIVCGRDRMSTHLAPLLRDCCHLVQRSNIWRYVLLLTQGGLYLDTDMEPYRNIEDLIDGKNAFCAQDFFTPGQGKSCMLGVTPGHKWLRETVDGLVSKNPRVSYSMGDKHIDSFRLQNLNDVSLLPRESVVCRWFPREPSPRTFVPSWSEVYAIHRYSATWYDVGYRQTKEDTK